MITLSYLAAIFTCFLNPFRRDQPEPRNSEPDRIQTPSGIEPQRQLSPTIPSSERGPTLSSTKELDFSAAYIVGNSEAPTTSARMSVQSFQNGFHSSTNSSRGSIVVDQLCKKLDDARILGLHGHTYFVPSSDIKVLITVPTIEEIILDRYPDMNVAKARRYAEDAKTSAQKLFANLAWWRKGAEICSFLDEEISDRDLPFERKKLGDQWSLWRTKPKGRIVASTSWDSREIEDFERTQWGMMATEFDRDDLACQELAVLTVLPFSHIEGKGGDEEDEEGNGEGNGEENEEENKKEDMGNYKEMSTRVPFMKTGGYSQVNAYRIHPAHHNFWHSSLTLEKQPLIVVKKLIGGDKTEKEKKIEFEKEKSILDLLAPQNHEHLIRLQSSYRKKGYYHLIFPYADGNLRTYWAKNGHPTFDKKTVLWSVRQMFGVTSALNCVHEFEVKADLDVSGGFRLVEGGAKLIVKKGEEKFGRHGDIKPENILWFKGEGVLKVADFGLGRFHGRDSRSGIDPRKISGTLTYEPPECSLARPVSRKYDIWSLGCLFLEFITWLLEGADKVDDFGNKRGLDTGFINDDTFFTVFTDENYEKNATVRNGVVLWVDDLHAHANCTQLIHELLDLVMRDMLKVAPDERQSAKCLKDKMEKLVQNAEECDTYLLKPTPRPSAKHFSPPKESSGPRVHWEK